ncbi:MAG: MarR family transcriptional regulator [Clostridiales bacterium]|nr:MAG: MarR family transcriptional regulator [Clostridiales bacterium]
MRKVREHCRQYNCIYYKYSELYHDLAAKYGFSDTQYWLLYTLYTGDEPVTQNELAIALCTPKQTVHSAITRLVKNGYLTLTQRPGPRNNKAVALTQAGEALCNRCVKPLVEAEEHAMAKISLEERELFLAVYEKRFNFFQKEITAILEENK